MSDENVDCGGLGKKTVAIVSCTGVIIGEDLIEGHSWTMGVWLLDTVGVCVCVLFSLNTCQLEMYM